MFPIHRLDVSIALWAAAVLFCACQPAHAQTIAEYSAAQRAAIAAEISRLTKPPEPASAPESAKPVSATPLPVKVRAPEPDIRVAGLSLVRGRSFVEVTVDGRVHSLEPGSAVPGTPWRLRSADAQQVVLVRGGKGSAPRQVEQRRVFRLEPLSRTL